MPYGKENVVNHSSLTARGLKLVIKRSLNFLSAQNTCSRVKPTKNQLLMLTVFINGRSTILMSLVCVRDLGINDDTSLREKVWFIFPWHSTPFQDTPVPVCVYMFVYIRVYIYITYIYIYKRVSRGCLKRLRIKVKYVKCVNTLKKLKKSPLLHLHEGIKWKAVWLDNGESGKTSCKDKTLRPKFVETIAYGVMRKRLVKRSNEGRLYAK